jgi:hypothetical protein
MEPECACYFFVSLKLPAGRIGPYTVINTYGFQVVPFALFKIYFLGNQILVSF